MSDTSAPRSAARIVIAEDEAIVRLDLKEMLEQAGHVVVGETGRGDEAIELVSEHDPDLVILDIKMPGMDGLRAAREITTTHGAAVILLTAFSQRDFIEEARDAGAAAYLIKPFRPTELLPAVESVLLRSRQERALEAEEGAPSAPAASSEDKLETRRLVESAKALLMESHAMSEADAFGFVQRTAMQNRRRMRDVATDVLNGSLRP
jgi:two-component system, response regulator PdtaR